MTNENGPNRYAAYNIQSFLGPMWVVGENGENFPYICSMWGGQSGKDNAHRIAASLNFCEGFTTEELEAVSLHERMELIFSARDLLNAGNLILLQKRVDGLLAKLEGAKVKL